MNSNSELRETIETLLKINNNNLASFTQFINEKQIILSGYDLYLNSLQESLKIIAKDGIAPLLKCNNMKYKSLDN